ncbi:MAG: helix-turn-helix transcriptional regulator [Clostridia bacterium]|nr:helix-turn-helix transcriptional regulator [Clostridia bacterium]
MNWVFMGENQEILIKPLELKDEIKIKDVVSVHYFEFSKTYKFPGERHDFWELVYVDRGKITAFYEDKKILLHSGDMIFHKPDEWHNLIADGENVSNVAVISFMCNSRPMKQFNNRIMKVNNLQRELLAKIVNESRALFKTPLDDPFTTEYEKQESYPFGAEQLIRMYLTELLISIVRNDARNMQTRFVQNTSSSLVNVVTDYLSEHIAEKITVADVEKFTNTSRTALESAFKSTVSTGVIDYFIKMKIEYAKTYIRENSYNITQIAELLGYDSIHYFSRQFKKVTKMSPKEYSNSIKAMGVKEDETP